MVKFQQFKGNCFLQPREKYKKSFTMIDIVWLQILQRCCGVVEMCLCVVIAQRRVKDAAETLLTSLSCAAWMTKRLRQVMYVCVCDCIAYIIACVHLLLELKQILDSLGYSLGYISIRILRVVFGLDFLHYFLHFL